MKSLKSIIHSLPLEERSEELAGKTQSQNRVNPNLFYGVLTLFFLVAAFLFYRGDNWRLLGPPFAPFSGQDFRQILRASQEIVNGENIYSHAIPYAHSPDFGQFMRWKASPYPYSPIVAVMAIPLLRYPEVAALIFWTALSWLLLFAAVIITIVGILRDKNIAKILAVLVFFSLYGPFHLNLNYIQLDIFILFLLCLAYFFYRKGSVFAGIALGFAISLKLLVAPLVIYFLWKKDWKTSALAALTAGTLTIIGFSVAGWDLLPDFIQVNYLWSVTDMLSFPFNQSIHGLGLRLFTNNSYIEPFMPIPFLAPLLRIIGIGFSAYLWISLVSRNDNRQSLTGFLEYGFTVTSMLFLSPLVDDVHYVWVLLPISGLLMTFSSLRLEKRQLLLFIFTLFCVLFMAHPDLHDAVYYGWESVAYDKTLVNKNYGLLTGAYVYGLIGLEICLAANLLGFRRRMESGSR